MDHDGNLFIADTGNHRIRRVDAVTGIISTVAGNGSASFTGDGGAATSASLNQPYGIAVATNGDLFIADTANYRVRRVNAATGLISTYAGIGSGGPIGDGGPATSANLSNVLDLAIDLKGNVFLAEWGRLRIRRIDAQTGIITTFAGNGSTAPVGNGGAATAAGLDLPRSVAVDAAGNVLISEAGSNRVRWVNGASGLIEAFAGVGGTPPSGNPTGDGGTATAAYLASPAGVAFDDAGTVYLTESIGRIRKVK